MAAPKGNQFWRARTKHGRDKLFSSPAILWDGACEYFQWVEDNPLTEYRLASTSGEPTAFPIPKMRPMTMEGLWLFLGIGSTGWYSYREYEDFAEVVKRIEDTVRRQKFEGAASGFFNANIIARDLGLKEATTNEHSGLGGGPIKTESTITFVGVNKESE